MKKVLVAAGHSDTDPGAVNVVLKTTEAKEAVRLRDLVANELGALGIAVIEDGLDGKNQPLVEAIRLAKGADLAVEFHFNAGPPTATGIECISQPKDKAFAKRLSAAISKATGGRLRGDAGWIDQSASQHSRLGFVVAGGVIVEVGFISNKADMLNYQAKYLVVAKAIASVIADEVKPV